MQPDNNRFIWIQRKIPSNKEISYQITFVQEDNAEKKLTVKLQYLYRMFRQTYKLTHGLSISVAQMQIQRLLKLEHNKDDKL